MLAKFYRINKAVGLGIRIRPDNSIELNACGIVLNNDKLDIDKKISGLSSIDELDRHFSPGELLSVNLTGKGVLQKQTSKIAEVNANNFNSIIPNGDLNDFYVQNFISGEYSFLTIIRRSEADNWLDQLAQKGFKPLLLSFGPFPLQHILPQLNVYDQDIRLDGYAIQRNENTDWTKVTYDEKITAKFPVKIESETISEKLLIPYAAAFQLVLSANVEPVRAVVPQLESDLAEVAANRKLKVNAFALLCAFFLVLLVNFAVLSYLTGSNNKLTSQLDDSNAGSLDIQQVNGQINQKEVLLKDLGWDGGINKASLIDQAASLLPETITLTEIAVNPVDEETSQVKKNLQFADRSMMISGYSESIMPVNEWIARLKTRSWAKDVQLISYLIDNEKNTGKFTIRIKY
jgi:Tfp pilus assembly protein PilN